MDTVTLARSAIRGLLRACDGEPPARCAVLRRGDACTAAGKPARD